MKLFVFAAAAALAYALAGGSKHAPRWLVVRATKGGPYTPWGPVEGDGKKEIAALAKVRRIALSKIKAALRSADLSAEGIKPFDVKWSYAIVETPRYEAGFMAQIHIPQVTGDVWKTTAFARTKAALTKPMAAFEPMLAQIREKLGFNVSIRVFATEAPVLFLDNPLGLHPMAQGEVGQVGAADAPTLGIFGALIARIAVQSKRARG